MSRRYAKNCAPAPRWRVIRVIETAWPAPHPGPPELVEAAVETLTYYAFPEEYWLPIRTNNRPSVSCAKSAGAPMSWAHVSEAGVSWRGRRAMREFLATAEKVHGLALTQNVGTRSS